LLDLRDQVRFVPDTGSFGVATLTFRAWAGGESPGTFVDTTDAGDDELSAAHVIEQEVVDTNARPTFATQPLTTAFEGVPYTYTVRASDADADQSLTFLADELPDWLSLIPLANRSARLTGTHPTEAGASYLITLRVTDGDTGHAVQSFTLSPVPADSPEWTLRAPLAWEDGSLYIDALASSGNTLLLAYNLSGERGFKAFDLVLTEDEDPRWVSAGEQVTGTNGLFAFENTTVAVGQPDAAIDLPDGTRIGAGKVQL